MRICLIFMMMVAVTARGQVVRESSARQNRALVYHGKLVRPDGSVPNGPTSVTVKILSPEPGLCLLWSETQTVEVRQGGFSMEIGHDDHRRSGTGAGAAADFKQVFVNNPGLTIGSATCASGTSYTPAVDDDRLMTATFNDGGEIVEVASLPIKSVPYALQAEAIGGYGLNNLMKISGASAVTYSPAEVSTLKDMLGADVFFDMKARLVKNVANPSSAQDAATKSYVDAAIAGLGGGGGGGTVTSVSVSGGGLSVSNGTTSPTLSLSQANTTTAGYLSAADWNTFNGKQPAGAYLTSITSGNVTTALGFTPLSQALAANQVFIGNGSSVATASFFGIEQMRNASGVAQFPGACTASQTLTWSAITDVLSCTNINNLDADKITSGTLSASRVPSLDAAKIATGTFASARLGAGTADGTTYLRGDGTWATPAGTDNLGNHTATANLRLGSHWLSGDGGNEGIAVDGSGKVGIGTVSPTETLHVVNPGYPAAGFGIYTVGGAKVFEAGGSSFGVYSGVGLVVGAGGRATFEGDGTNISLDAQKGILARDVIGSYAGVLRGVKLVSDLPDSATAVGLSFDATGGFTTAGAKLLSLRNAGVEKAAINKDGGASFTALDVGGMGDGTQNIKIGSTTGYPAMSGGVLELENYFGASTHGVYSDNSGNFRLAKKGATESVVLDYVGATPRWTSGTLQLTAGGAVTAPSIAMDSTNGDESGLYLPALNNIGIVTDRLERVRIDGNGRVGIGTPSPTEALEVAGKVKGTELCIGTDCRASWPSGGGGGARQFMEVRYITADNVDGAAMTSSYVTMPLTNTISNTITGASLASNAITLPAGTYHLQATFRCIGVSSTGSAKIRLQNDTASSVMLVNTGKVNMNGVYFTVPFNHVFTLAGTSAIRFDGKTNSSSLSCAFTDDFVDGDAEAHSVVIIEKL